MSEKIIRAAPHDMDVDSIPSGCVGFIDPQGYPRSWNPKEEFPDYLLMRGCAAYMDKALFDRDAAQAIEDMEARGSAIPDGARATARPTRQPKVNQ